MRAEQEDRYVHVPIAIKKTGLTGHLIALMDGHSYSSRGHIVSENCKQLIPQLFRIQYADQAEAALAELVQKLNQILTPVLSDETPCYYTPDGYMQGSTLSIALVMESHHRVCYAILGDSPVFQVEQDGTYLLPVHNACSSARERSAAIRRGGVYQCPYIYILQSETYSWDRRPRGTQLTRSIGDNYMRQVVSHIPEIISSRITPHSSVLLTTDGVCNSRDPDFIRISSKLCDSVRQGFDASQIMQQRLSFKMLMDEGTVGLWSATH